MRVTVSRADELSRDALAAVRAARLAALLRRCGDELGVPPRASLALRLAGDAELADLNARFRGVEGPTDVLAFPGGGGHVGDVAISVDRALEQGGTWTPSRDAPSGLRAAEVPGGAVAELRLLAVHGLLHCLGHDHAEPQGAAAMTAATRALLPGQPVADLEVHAD